MKRENPHPNLPVNETHSHIKLSNVRGAAAVAHWDVPDNGNSEFFISLQDNAHLDAAYGGYCVFAQVEADDKDSWSTVDTIAKRIAQEKKQPRIESIRVE